jgi:hypothetical protein
MRGKKMRSLIDQRKYAYMKKFLLGFVCVLVVVGVANMNLMDTKGGRNRHPLMTDQVKEVFLKKEPGSPGDLVFPSRNDKIRKAISKVFAATVSELGLNKNCIGPRDKVVFHTL